MTPTMIDQIDIFINMCKFAKTNAHFGGNGITKKDLIRKGVSEPVFQWLVKNHYCNDQKTGRPLWVAINGNKLYPQATVQNLEKLVNDFRASQQQNNNNPPPSN